MRRALGLLALAVGLALVAWALWGEEAAPPLERAAAPRMIAPREFEPTAVRPVSGPPPMPEPSRAPSLPPPPLPPEPPPPPEDARPLTDAERADVRAALAALAPQIRQCFEQGYAIDPELEGTVEVELTLAPVLGGGGVARDAALVRSTLGAPLVEACVRAKLQRAGVPEMQGRHEVRVRHVFRLEADVEFGRPPEEPYSPR